MKTTQFTEVAKETLETALNELGAEMKGSAQVVAAYAAERAAFLSTLMGQPGYEEAVLAERDSVAIRAGIATAAQADAVEQRMLGVLQGILQVGASILVA